MNVEFGIRKWNSVIRRNFTTHTTYVAYTTVVHNIFTQTVYELLTESWRAGVNARARGRYQNARFIGGTGASQF